jgi:hypothetical protein
VGDLRVAGHLPMARSWLLARMNPSTPELGGFLMRGTRARTGFTSVDPAAVPATPRPGSRPMSAVGAVELRPGGI